MKCKYVSRNSLNNQPKSDKLGGVSIFTTFPPSSLIPWIGLNIPISMGSCRSELERTSDSTQICKQAKKYNGTKLMDVNIS